MKTQTSPTKLALLVCTCAAVICAAQEGVIAAADWNLFDSHHSDTSDLAPFSALSGVAGDAELELRCPRISTPTGLLPTLETGAAPADRTASDPAADAMPEDCIEFGYGFDYAHPAARYAGDAYMVEHDDASPDVMDDAVESDAAAAEEDPISMLILEDEDSLAAALAAVVSAVVEVAVPEETPEDPFLLEDEGSLAAAIELLDAAQNKESAEESAEETAWVAVETEEVDTYTADEAPADEIDDVPEEAVHDWLYYDYTYEPDYFESTESAADLYPDAYALDADSTGDDTVVETQNNAELIGETEPDYPDYYQYDHGMFEYVGNSPEADTTDDSADDANADANDDAADDAVDASDDATDDAIDRGQDPMNDPAGDSSADAEWTEYERAHRNDFAAADGENADADDWAEDSADDANADATDGAMFVAEPEEFEDAQASDEPLKRDEGTWDRGTVDEGTLDDGTVEQGTLDEGTVEKGAVEQGIPEESDQPDADAPTSPNSPSQNEDAPADAKPAAAGA